MRLAAMQSVHPEFVIETDVIDLLTIVADGLPVDADHYPELGTVYPDVDRFCLRHSALHFAKTAGQLAAVAEATDHGGHIDRDKVAKIAAAGLINSLKLANEIGLTATEVCELVVRKLGR